MAPSPTPRHLAGIQHGLLGPCNPGLGENGGVRVLVVEDEADIADAVVEGLRDKGLAVDVAYDGESGADKALLNAYDVVVLDRDLPGLHGDLVCSMLVDSGVESRILMLTAAATVDERVTGLNLGADDYLPKPFAFSELVARVMALGRRAPASAPVLTSADLVLDRARRQASRFGLALSLTRKEFGVLETLMVADGAVVSAEELLEKVWDERADLFSQVVSVTVARLRRKLGEPDPIETVIGAGYRWR